jgi:hypothetical protein
VLEHKRFVLLVQVLVGAARARICASIALRTVRNYLAFEHILALRIFAAPGDGFPVASVGQSERRSSAPTALATIPALAKIA